MPQGIAYSDKLSAAASCSFALTDVELCTMLGNLLENALDACRRMTPATDASPRTIRLFTKETGMLSSSAWKTPTTESFSPTKAFLSRSAMANAPHRHLLHPRNRRTSRRQCVRLSDGASLPRRNYVADEVGSSKSPHTAYCFAQLKQGTC